MDDTALVKLLSERFQRREKIILLDYLNGFAGKKPLIKGTLWSRNSSAQNIYNLLISARRFKAIKHSVMNDWPHSKPINDVMIELPFTE